MPTASEHGYVILRGGLAMPVAPVLLVLALEQRGLTISRDGDDLLVRPPGRLTDDDRQQLCRFKRHVLALLDYEPDRA